MRRLPVLALWLWAGQVHADPSWECSIISSSQIETGKCLADTEATVNDVLDAALTVSRQVAKKLDEITAREVALPALELSQETWEAYRDAECDYNGARYAGGSGTGIAIRSCRIALTRDRIRSLQDGSR